ncbi:uncharacterized protein LOC143208119 [Lasioglossum baleicum]|uniref:uncharacterized protein LOC143208119 n=1 Tax=Lasioglossum baleicum TaxID=434251 RepID=UPI003FCDF8A3
MPINKFGAMLRNESNKDGETCKNYVRSSALCLDGDAFDARDRKIRRLASPTNDADAVNKVYMDKKMTHILKACDAKSSKLREEILTKLKFLQKTQLVEELHAPARRIFPRRRVLVHGYDDLWQADLVDMQPHARINGGNKYILTVIDVLSKYAWGVPLKTKSGGEVAAAFRMIFRNRCPKNLQTDQGKEFYNSEMHKLLTKRGINHYSTYSVMKASIVERFNRTLKNSMWKEFTLNGTYKWINVLPHLVAKYNAQKHRTIGMRPCDVTPTISNRLLYTAYNNIKIAAPAKFNVGQSVRISKFKTIFDKGYTPNWTTEVFEIVKVQATNPVTYLLQDSCGNPVAGGFYEHELHRVANPGVHLVEKVLRRKGNKVYVKWLGLSNDSNPGLPLGRPTH